MSTRKRKTNMPKEVVDLGNRIKELIDKNGFKLREVAHDAGLDTENLRKYIKGTQEMKVSTMLKIAKALGVEAGDLF